MSETSSDSPDDRAPAISAVVVTFNSGAHISLTLAALAAQLQAGDELIVVDNGSSDDCVARARAAAPGVHVIEQGNVGFAGGCNAGAAVAHGDLLFFLNPDAVLEAGALEALREQAAHAPSWQAWQALVLLAGGERVNTAGGVVHFTGIGWAGRCGDELAAIESRSHPVAFASGAALVVRRAAWERLGGMPERYFMYAEDLELGLRVWLGGGEVGVAPAARVVHDYEFTKGDYKWRMLERNRWATVLTTFPGALLAALLPALLVTELALVLVAARGGWLGAKLRSWGDLIAWLPWIARRRRVVQRERAIGAAEFATLLQPQLDSPFIELPRGLSGIVSAGLRAYWRVCLALLGRPTRRLLG